MSVCQLTILKFEYWHYLPKMTQQVKELIQDPSLPLTYPILSHNTILLLQVCIEREFLKKWAFITLPSLLHLLNNQIFTPSIHLFCFSKINSLHFLLLMVLLKILNIESYQKPRKFQVHYQPWLPYVLCITAVF